jgi:hypothetical protein
MNVDNVKHKCAAWRLLHPADDRLDLESRLLARDMCESALRGLDDEESRRLRAMLARADCEVLRLFSGAEFDDRRLAELRDVLEDYRRAYYGPLRSHFAPAPERERWWLWLDRVASGDFEAPHPVEVEFHV